MVRRRLHRAAQPGRVLPTGDMSLIINLYEDRTRIYDPNDPSKCKTLSGAILVGAYSDSP